MKLYQVDIIKKSIDKYDQPLDKKQIKSLEITGVLIDQFELTKRYIIDIESKTTNEKIILLTTKK